MNKSEEKCEMWRIQKSLCHEVLYHVLKVLLGITNLKKGLGAEELVLQNISLDMLYIIRTSLISISISIEQLAYCSNVLTPLFIYCYIDERKVSFKIDFKPTNSI